VRVATRARLAVGPSTDRRVRRRVALAWGLLVLNVLTYYTQMTLLLPLPGVLGKLITQGALGGALLVALSVNRPVVLRRSVFLTLFTLLAAESLMTSVRAEFVFGTVFRAGRLALFVAVLWLLSPWWGRRDMLLVRCHVAALGAVLVTIAAGALAAPGLAFAEGRLQGVIWPVPPTQVGHYAAMVAGLLTVLWLAGRVRRGLVLLVAPFAATLLLLSHTRTALAAATVGTVVAGLSLFNIRARVRRVFAAAVALVFVVAVTAAPTVTTWLARGQTADDLANLTGRRTVWDGVLDTPRSPFTFLFGFGLSDKSFEGLPIDSNWLATYYDSGLLGVTISAVVVLLGWVSACFCPDRPSRAVALFLVTYCGIASFTETSLSDASPYVLELTLAASLIAAGRRAGDPA
jgi:hypothetical protein